MFCQKCQKSSNISVIFISVENEMKYALGGWGGEGEERSAGQSLGHRRRVGRHLEREHDGGLKDSYQSATSNRNSRESD